MSLTVVSMRHISSGRVVRTICLYPRFDSQSRWLWQWRVRCQLRKRPIPPGRVFEAFTELSGPAEDARWPDLSRPARAQRRQSWQQLLARAKALETSSSPTERLSLAIIERDLAERLEGEPFDTYMLPLNFTGGFRNDVITTITLRPTGAAADYEDTLA